MDKKKKIMIIAIAALVIIAGAVTAVIAVNHKGGITPEETSGEPVYVEVTDENGEPVTDENGEVVTELAAGGNTADNKTTDKANTSAADKNESTSAKDKSETTTKQTIKKPAAPKAVTGLKISSATADTIEISWNKVDCDGYQISYSEDNVNWQYYPEQKDLGSFYTKTSMKFTKLDPATTYYFSVRAYNKNAAGTSASAWSETVYGDTKNIETAGQITFYVTLPMDSNMTIHWSFGLMMNLFTAERFL